MEEIEKQAKQMVANQEYTDARIKELETKLQEQIIKTEKLQVMLHGYVVTVRERMEESGRKRLAKQRALKTALEEKLNKDSKKEELESMLHDQKKKKPRIKSQRHQETNGEYARSIHRGETNGKRL
jgi:hypothetical protein